MTEPARIEPGAFAVARAVADTVLFEGYVLYPYRASSRKNQVRWQFGVLAPAGGATGGEPSAARTECLVEMGERCGLDVRVRFLHVRSRTGAGPDWDEAEVREVDASTPLDRLDGELAIPFAIPGGEETDGDVRRRTEPLCGVVRIAAERFDGPYSLARLRITVENTTPGDPSATREEMLRRSLVSAHTLLAVRDGEFVSLLEPPEWARAAAESCRNEHTWPVLVGEPDRRDVMLSSPIILYDYPAIAPESPGDLFDATEIDEILTLRTMALTDAEKQEARATDERAAAVIDRVDGLPPEMLDRLHGTLRYLRDVTGEPEGPEIGDVPWWDPGADDSVNPEHDAVAVPGGLATRGSKVRLHPAPRSTDAQDMFMAGRLATVAAVFLDVDGASHLAVTVDDDPAAELNQWVGRYRYYAPDEVELEQP
jgi:hypothetical protein